ncbi:MAG: restriction endonuclease subunit S [Olsenella umbonata]|nr:restriction endonuclease subunit S [Parafannyhessea umbonata]
MKKLNEKEWRTFPAFSDDGLFHIATTSSSIDAVRLKDGDDKTVPYVTRSDMSNGVARFVSAENYDFGSDDGGCITVGLDTQTAFYQPHKFVTGQNVHVVTGEQLSEEVAFFLVTILREQMQAKFNWGGNGATLGRMKRLLVMLPVNDNGKPDYGYMAQYASEMRGACSCGIGTMSLGSSHSWNTRKSLHWMRRSGKSFGLASCLKSAAQKPETRTITT